MSGSCIRCLAYSEFNSTLEGRLFFDVVDTVLGAPP
jgi:hypothetical protein